LRNAVVIAFNPESGNLWVAVNERDNMGDDVPSDFFTHVVAAGFYGWPYAYRGQHVDKRVACCPDLDAKTITPDMLLRAHVALLQFAFCEKQTVRAWKSAPRYTVMGASFDPC
jgi:glucose/arabinose dehydrogenase